MRLLRFLNERFDVAEIKKLCPKAWSLDAGLYRGMNVSGEYGKIVVDKNRKPRDTSSEFHTLLDNAFKEVFGIKARSQTIFCTGDQHQASNYGDVCKIYLPDKFVCIWSDTIIDLFDFANIFRKVDSRESYLIALSYLYFYYQKQFSVLDDSIFKKFLQKNKVETPVEVLNLHPDCAIKFVRKYYKKGISFTDLQKAIKTNNEIMVHCDFYCYAREEFDPYEEFED